MTPGQRATLATIAAHAQRRSCSLFVVGGYVRDLLRGVEIHDRDIDIVVDGDALTFATDLQQQIGGSLKLFPSFLTAKLFASTQFVDLDEIDFASSRSETYPTPGALPLVTGAPLALDLERRDFSINAIAIPLGELISLHEKQKLNREEAIAACLDPQLGIKDLENRSIRILHAQSFVDDPTRLFRALRYCARIKGQLEEKTTFAFSDAVASGALSTISFRRIYNELVKMLAEKQAHQCICAADERGLLRATSTLPSNHLVKLSETVEKMEGTKQLNFSYLLLFLFASVLNEEERIALYNTLSVAKLIRKKCEQDLITPESREASIFRNVFK